MSEPEGYRATAANFQEAIDRLQRCRAVVEQIKTTVDETLNRIEPIQFVLERSLVQAPGEYLRNMEACSLRLIAVRNNAEHSLNGANQAAKTGAKALSVIELYRDLNEGDEEIKRYEDEFSSAMWEIHSSGEEIAHLRAQLERRQAELLKALPKLAIV